MKKVLLVAILAAVSTVQATLVDFNELNPGTNGYYTASTLGPSDWQSGGATFETHIDPTYGSWSGWTYSNVNDPNTVGYGNQYAVYGNGTGYGGSGNYAVSYLDGFNAVTPTVRFADATQVDGFYAHNTAYAALDMINGGYFPSAFSTNDWFKLTVEGFDGAAQSVGSVDFSLADFTGYTAGDHKNDYIVTDWSYVDLSGLGDPVHELTFTVSSSQVYTPVYFAMDNLSFETVPEPSSVILLAGGFGGVLWFRRRRKYYFRG